MTDLRTLKKFSKSDFRHEYIAGRVRSYIAMQIRVIREKLELSQEELAKKLGTKQTAISRLENLAYGRVSINTLLQIAKAFDVAIVVRFVSFDEFLSQHRDVSPDALAVETFNETLLRYAAGERQPEPSRALKEELTRLPAGSPTFGRLQPLVANTMTAIGMASTFSSGPIPRPLCGGLMFEVGNNPSQEKSRSGVAA